MKLTNRQRHWSAQAPRSVVFEEFLVWSELGALMDFTLARERDFAASRVVAGSDPPYRDHRRSRVLLDAGPFYGLLSQRIEFYFCRVLEALDQPLFDISRVEMQVTASNDGDY